MFEKWMTNGGIVGSGAGSCCGGVWHHFLGVGWLWVGGGVIGEAICVGVSDGKWGPIATRRGGVLSRSWRGGSAVFRMCCALTLNGCSNFVDAVERRRNLGLTADVLSGVPHGTGAFALLTIHQRSTRVN